MSAVVAAFNQEKALVGAFSVIVQLINRFAALFQTLLSCSGVSAFCPVRWKVYVNIFLVFLIFSIMQVEVEVTLGTPDAYSSIPLV